MLWFQDTPVIGWVLAAAAFLYVLYVLLIGIAALFSIIVVLLSGVGSKSASS
jgi:hypothetical protein